VSFIGHRLSRFGKRRVWRSVRPSSGQPVGLGQSMVEFTVITPLFLLILLGTIDLGRMYNDYVDLKNGARDGAGYGMLRPTDTDGIKAAVLASGVPAGTTPTATCTGNCSTIDGTGEVVVTAQSTFTSSTLGFFSWLGLDGSITLSATSKMRVLT
jgi:Flp pilus assembly protein TadG